MSKLFFQKLRMCASEADDLLATCDVTDLLEGLEVARDFMFEAANEIEQLETRLAQVEMERDAMSYDMHQLQGALCAYCENLYRPAGSKKVSCKVFGDGYGAEDGSPLICGRFKWRGICSENTKEEA